MTRQMNGGRAADRGAKAKQEAEQKKITDGKKIAFVNIKKKGEADRTKEKLREIAEKI